jgi:psiF repeat
MRRSTWLMAIGAALIILAAQAPGAQADENSQQMKMTSCNADATSKGLKGDDRSAFMKTCLSHSSTTSSTKTNSQQEKMKTCNADASAKALKGDDRSAFMKTCLSGSSAAH